METAIDESREPLVAVSAMRCVLDIPGVPVENSPSMLEGPRYPFRSTLLHFICRDVQIYLTSRGIHRDATCGIPRRVSIEFIAL